MKAAIYIRVSTPGQAEEEKASLEEQEQRCRQHCEIKGHIVVAVYSDIGSGATKNRHHFQQMLRDAKADKFDVIVAWKADRLARGIYPCAALMEALENSNIMIDTVAEPFDRTTFEIRAVLGRIELENIAQRTQMGREGKISRGTHHPRPPFGWNYSKATKQWVINEFEAECVRQIFEWYIAGVSTAEIAQRLNNAGVPTKQRSKLGWTEQAVSRLVNCEHYTGVAYYNKRDGHTHKAKDQEKLVKMSVPAIISRETFKAAKARRQTNKHFSPRNTQRFYLTQGILVCEECGRPMKIRSGGHGQPALICQGMMLYPHLFNCRSPKSVLYPPIANRLWEGMVGILGSDEGLEMAIRSRVEHVASAREAIERRLDELARNRSDLKREQDTVITWARKGNITEDQLNTQLGAIQAEDEQYAAEEDRLLADLRLQGNVEAVYFKAKELIPMMRERLNASLTPKDKQDLIRLLVRRALLDREGNMTLELMVPAPEMSFGYSTC